MKKIDWKMLVVTSSLFLIPLVLVSLYYGQLPAVLHTHFGADNVANQTSSKWMSLIFIPLLAFLFHVFLCIALDVTKNGQVPVVKVGKWMMPILTILVMVTILWYNLGNQVDIRRLVVAFLAGVYLIMGNYMPKDVPGMTAPQSLVDRKRAAYLFIGGAVALLLSLFFEPIVSFIVGLLFTAVIIIWSIRVGVKGYRNCQ
ncbi:DUF1648 domain-containing protein [Streptococcus sp. zg-86]|uniref:DUF1648 domain-containing protein n=1 Tax=Streptococcus zhangguiae TaxID=2664091 RepID=A0A6I4RBP1_9STRE|nr:MULTISPECIES: DUF1648 domain-containing protein [unclassified Streptococcus]MTB64130.1 DUF1648 domain-containing protein [Streptococcus sp. zg-86]MTB90544.1 DUF1648 domain-containing protein [Streptococcus sp. zg-36]MWV56118.1 DUF1648 domain-containing protein [Streptococcus sp. zg-70]QTH48258.1 DUF1648 domain-containing protein [Streptococcus sp. zg-86]